jgi:hypothetical protein
MLDSVGNCSFFLFSISQRKTTDLRHGYDRQHGEIHYARHHCPTAVTSAAVDPDDHSN